MANDRLRTAMIAAGLTVDVLATKVGVDPKTVERWIGNETRKPHRTTRQQVATVLRTREMDLWPAAVSDLPSNGHENELVQLYPSRSSITGPTWQRLIGDVSEQMDVLVFSGAFLVEQYNLVPVIQRKAAEGVRFRLLVGDEAAPAVVERAVDEGTPGGLEGRVQLMRRYLAEVADLDGVEVRTHGTILYNSLYRFDEDLLVNGHAHGALAGQNPVLHLKRLPDGHMWEHYMRSFERVWNQATPEPTE
ncbi:helix-turn-helix domain-containing protein [Saccharomonospora halophila]|uniref:helix-turn-helix domain-containing protein n=1 Tax=Saccharomonospora halophila TaxID=129922 RepID=UPI00037229F6|nr:helix-turn-helix transcriptional regulator [Saccharomonospora halophila]